MLSDCLIIPCVRLSIVIVLTTHDPHSMFNILVYIYSSLSVCLSVRLSVYDHLFCADFE